MIVFLMVGVVASGGVAGVRRCARARGTRQRRRRRRQRGEGGRGWVKRTEKERKRLRVRNGAGSVKANPEKNQEKLKNRPPNQTTERRERDIYYNKITSGTPARPRRGQRSEVGRSRFPRRSEVRGTGKRDRFPPRPPVSRRDPSARFAPPHTRARVCEGEGMRSPPPPPLFFNGRLTVTRTIPPHPRSGGKRGL